MPPGPSRTGWNGRVSIAKLAFRATENSDALTDLRQEIELSGVAVAQDGTLFVKSIQDARSRFASKLKNEDAVPDWKIWKMRHHEIWNHADVREKSAYSSSGKSGKIVVEVVIGGRHCSFALSKNGDLWWFVISAMAEDKDLCTHLAGISAKRCDVLLHPLQSNTLIM